MNDKFSRLRAIQQNKNTKPNTGQKVKFWKYDQDGDILGTIREFCCFDHPCYGEQHTVVVQLADSNELVSAFLTPWLQEGMRRQQAEVGDLALIIFLGKKPGERYNEFILHIDKNSSEFF